MLDHWKKSPPLHRLFAMFVGYGEGSSEAAPRKKQGFEITPGMLQAFGGAKRQVCRQANLPPDARKRVEEFQSTEAYKNFRRRVDGKVKHG